MATRTEMLALGSNRQLGCVAVYGTHGLRSTRFAVSAVSTPDGQHTLASATFYDMSQNPMPVDTDSGDPVTCRTVIATRYVACESVQDASASLPVAARLLVPSRMVPAVFGGDRAPAVITPDGPDPDGVFRLRAVGIQRAARGGREYVTVHPDDPLFERALGRQFISPWQRTVVPLRLLVEPNPDVNPTLRFRRHIQNIRPYRSLSDHQPQHVAA